VIACHDQGVREEVQVQVERVPVGPFTWDGDDHPLSRHPPQLGQRLVDSLDVFEGMGADDGIELAVAKWKLFDVAFDEPEIVAVGHSGVEDYVASRAVVADLAESLAR
jgi:hypothetical protein